MAKEHCARCGEPADFHVHMIVILDASGVKQEEEKKTLPFCNGCKDKAHKTTKDVSKDLVKQLLSR